MDESLKGKRVMLIHMEDTQAPPPGTHGTIKGTDDIGQIHVNWDNGSRLAISPHDDKYQIFD